MLRQIGQGTTVETSPTPSCKNFMFRGVVYVMGDRIAQGEFSDVYFANSKLNPADKVTLKFYDKRKIIGRSDKKANILVI